MQHTLKSKQERNQLGAGPRKAQTGTFSVKETEGQGRAQPRVTQQSALNTAPALTAPASVSCGMSLPCPSCTAVPAEGNLSLWELQSQNP